MYNIMPTLNSSVSPGGGRFDFDDGGTYCGGWQDGKAHGHGVCTGPKGLGEYSGSWDFGFEVSGVYKWQNGAVYEGKWQNGKRHGVGVEYNGKWIYKGEWTQGYKGRYGVRSSSISAVKYEGTWANGLQDGYGWETYADGGSYQGQWCRGTRHGYGVRASAPYGDKNSNNQQQQQQQNSSDNSIMIGSKQLNKMSSSHSNPMHSSVMDIDDEPFSNEETRPTTERLKASNNGFVLVAKAIDPTPASSKYGDKSRRNSLVDKATHSRIPGTHTTATLLRGLRFKKQRSTSDLDSASGRHTPGSNSMDSRKPGKKGSSDYELSLESSGHTLPLALSPEELDINDPSTVETYMGEWKQDKRSGHGVCERSDGLKYEGQWHNDMKCGYGITTHRDGTKEEGKYKNNILVVDSKVKKIFHLRGANLRQKIDEAIELANQAQEVALKKADIAITRAATSRDKAEQATERAADALKDSRIAHSVARQYSDSQVNGPGAQPPPGMGHLHASILAGGGGAGSSGLENQLRRRLSYFAHHHGEPGVKSSGMHDIQSEYDEAAAALMAAHHHLDQLQQSHQADHQHLNLHHHPLDVHDSNFNINQLSQHDDNIHHQQQQQFKRYPGPLEPFGGRRGSFRVSAGGALPTGGSGAGLINNHHSNNIMQQNLNNPMGTTSSNKAGSNLLSQTDPFNDHFDHYRTTSNTNNNSSFDSDRSTRNSRFLKKQTSFDQSNLRHQYSATNHQTPSPVSNQSQPHQHHLQYSRQNSADLIATTDKTNPMSTLNHSRHQFSHLVTSGEDLLAGMSDHGGHSSGTPHAPSTFYGSQASSPSPADVMLNRLTGGANRNNNNSSILHHHQLRSNLMYNNNNNNNNNHHTNNIRSGSEPRQMRRNYGLQRQTTSNNYDFSVSSPNPAARTRRTASLTRHPILPLANSSRNSFERQPTATSHTGSTVVIGSTLPNSNDNNNNQGSIASISRTIQQISLGASPNHQHSTVDNETYSPLFKGLVVGSSGLNLSRKPSLQVRYDPQAIGGIMSREEVAALSHAQREQRRLENEMAERRRRNPLLFFFLTAKELINRQKLVLVVLIVNIILFFIFADLLS